MELHINKSFVFIFLYALIMSIQSLNYFKLSFNFGVGTD